MVVEVPSSEVAILRRVLRPRVGALSAAAARAWLKLDFSEEDRQRMHALVQKGREGRLLPEDEEALDNYRRAGRVLDLRHSKARLSLKKRTPAS
jgi:hypothetical protein